MKTKNRKHLWWLVALLVVAMPGAAIAQVSVSAEGAYTESELVVNILADITGDPLCSFGVSLNYDQSKLTPNMDPTETNINQAIWYFGSPPPSNIACPNCVADTDTDTGKKIVFLGGKLDTASPSAGVSPQNRVLLAKATFNRTGDTNFGISLGLGKTNPTPPQSFDNFVALTTPTPTVLDGSVAFTSVTIRQMGDLDGNGIITNRDFAQLRGMLSDGSYAVWADLDGNGIITNRDLALLRGLLN